MFQVSTVSFYNWAQRPEVYFVLCGGACGAMAQFLQIAAPLKSFLFDFYLSRRSHKLSGIKNLSFYTSCCRWRTKTV